MIRFPRASSASVYRTLLAAFTLLALSACAGNNGDDDPALGSGKLRWNSFPVQIQADSSLLDGGEAEADLHAAISFWETRAGKPLFQLSSWPSGQAPYFGSPMNPAVLLGNVIFFQHSWPNAGDWGPQIAGKTVITSTHGSIDHAVVFLNGETPLCADACEDGSSGQTSRRRLIAHELGHFLGFAHVQDISNIMYPTIQTGGDLEAENIDSDLLRRLTQ